MIDDGKKGSGDAPPEWKVAGGNGTAGSFAHRPGRVLVSRAAWERLADDAAFQERIRERLKSALVEVGLGPDHEQRLRSIAVLEGAPDVRRAITALRAEGIEARPDHVFFAVPRSGSVSSAPVMFGGVSGSPVMFGGVGGAPVMFGGVDGAPVMFGGVSGAPVMFGGVGGAPVMFGGFWGVPVMFGGGGGHGCGSCCGSPTLPSAPDTPRRSTVRRADAPDPALHADDQGPPAPVHECRVVVVDTGLAADGLVPQALDVSPLGGGGRDTPDFDQNDQLDAATGHGTFIAGVVKRLAPHTTVEVRQVLTTFGDASDAEVAAVLWELVAAPPTVVNLSFAGYADDDTTPPAIAEAIAELLDLGVVVVAAAGNDGTCRPAWPAATEGVIGVGALDDSGPAWFTNHGQWVQACAPGVDVLSNFFAYADPSATSGAVDPTLDRPSSGPDADLQPDHSGWARWSGTSFAAPIVAGVLARRITDGAAPAGAVRSVVEDPDLFRIQGLGTVVNVRPW